MRQILENLKTGEIELADVPRPAPRAGTLVIRSRASLVSAGTERMLVEFGKAGLIEKARREPERVRQVLAKVRTDGLAATLSAVKSKLDRPIALGYSSVGTVLEVGEGVRGLAPGDRVASNGPHAEVVCVPANLCARVPDGVPDEAAAFTVVGAIALQGVRLAEPTLGESFAVIGLGLIGLLTVQILNANGCRVVGIDMDPAKLELARGFGAGTIDLSRVEDPASDAVEFSRGRGIDGVLICASTKESDPVHHAAQMCRKRGRIVLVGVTGLALSRADFYEKEISFQVSCSYGPGRYDPEYEEKGRDYPFGFVRWTEQRNMEAVLGMLADGSIDTGPLVTHRIPFDRALEAYEILGSGSPSIGILLEHPAAEEGPSSAAITERFVSLSSPGGAARAQEPAVAFIGAGNYATRELAPAFKRSGVDLRTIVSSGGASAVHGGRSFGFGEASTDTDRVLADDAIDTIVIATRHDSHADLVARALRAGKHVFVENPIAIDRAGLERIEAAVTESDPSPLLMVGFNRRFAPHTRKIAELLRGTTEPKSFVVTVNAGAIPSDHWTQDPEVGGGRIVGEGCHFVDLLRFLAGAPIVSVRTTGMGGDSGAAALGDNASFTLGFADGSFGTVHYLANGHRSFPKERIEVFVSGRILALDNFVRLRGYGWRGFSGMRLSRQDKGQEACVRAFVDALRGGGASPIPLSELLEVSRATIAIGEEVSGRAA